jgi:hypothetical protein
MRSAAPSQRRSGQELEGTGRDPLWPGHAGRVPTATGPIAIGRRVESGKTRLSKRTSSPRTLGRRTSTVPTPVAESTGLAVAVAVARLRLFLGAPLAHGSAQQRPYSLFQEGLNELPVLQQQLRRW